MNDFLQCNSFLSFLFFFSSRRRHTRSDRDWSSDVCSSDLGVAVDVLLQGAGDGGATGLRRYLRAHRTELRPADTVVLGIGPSGDGRPSWWHSDGRLVPLRYAPALRELSRRVAADEPHLGATRHRGRGAAPAYPAR